MEKWYIYKKYMFDTYIPLFWDEYLLEFDTKESAEDFIAVAQRELNFDFTNVEIKNTVHFSGSVQFMNATNYRIRAGFGGIKDYLYDIRKE